MGTKTFNIVLPVELVSKIDATAKREYRNRSELIREAARLYIEEKEGRALDIADSFEAERAKKESKRSFSSYLKRRWGRKTV